MPLHFSSESSALFLRKQLAIFLQSHQLRKDCGAILHLYTICVRLPIHTTDYSEFNPPWHQQLPLCIKCLSLLALECRDSSSSEHGQPWLRHSFAGNIRTNLKPSARACDIFPTAAPIEIAWRSRFTSMGYRCPEKIRLCTDTHLFTDHRQSKYQSRVRLGKCI